MTAPQAVLFDIGNVLISWDPTRLYSQVVPDPAARARLFAEAELDAMNERIDRGAPFRETVYAQAEAHPEHAEAIRLWHDRWIEMFAPAIEGSWAILRHLRQQGVPVFALSNFGIESFAHAEARYPGLTEFDLRFISGHMKTMTPETGILFRAMDPDDLAGRAELFFTDDRADNIAAAEARGWIGHLFESPAGLAQALRAAGVDPGQDLRGTGG